MKSIILFLINSNIWVAFCALALSMRSEILLESNNFKVSQFIFFSTIFAYNFQRIVRLKKGDDHSYKKWVSENKKAICFLIFITIIACGYLFFGFKSTTQLTVLFIGIISLLYPFGLRQIPFAKIFIISFVWSVSTILLLVFENNIIADQNIVFHFMSLFLFVFAITVPFDIRDVDYDSKKIITIPLFFGVQRAKSIAFFALLICGSISFFQHIKMILNLSNLLALILLYIVSFILIQNSDKNNGKLYFSFWVESLGVFSYFFLIISELIF